MVTGIGKVFIFENFSLFYKMLTIILCYQDLHTTQTLINLPFCFKRIKYVQVTLFACNKSQIEWKIRVKFDTEKLF